MFITADQVLAHLIGDYVLQSDALATTKTQKSTAAIAHALIYSLTFLVFRPSPAAFAFIFGTHFVIDRWRLARYVVWAKNWIAPLPWPMCPACNGPVPPGTIGIWTSACPPDRRPHRIKPTPPWSQCQVTGYPPDRPQWLTFWLMIIVDGLLHVFCNGLALKYL